MPKRKLKNQENEVLQVEVISPLPDRRYVLMILAEAIEKQHHKATKGKIFNPTNEKIRINQWKSLVHTCNIYNNVLKDMQIDEIKYELNAIKNAMIVNEDNEMIPDNDEIVDGIDKVENALKLLDGKTNDGGGIDEHEDE